MKIKIDFLFLIIILLLSSTNSTQKINVSSLALNKVASCRTPLYLSNELTYYKEFDVQKEIWKDIKNYEGRYQISNFGRIKTFCYNKKYVAIRKIRINSNYKACDLFKNKKTKRFYIHRLIAIHFIEKKYNNTEINHKDGNKLNNNISNLEWVTHSENIQHAYDNNLIKKQRRLI